MQLTLTIFLCNCQIWCADPADVQGCMFRVTFPGQVHFSFFPQRAASYNPVFVSLLLGHDVSRSHEIWCICENRCQSLCDCSTPSLTCLADLVAIWSFSCMYLTCLLCSATMSLWSATMSLLPASLTKQCASLSHESYYAWILHIWMW